MFPMRWRSLAFPHCETGKEEPESSVARAHAKTVLIGPSSSLGSGDWRGGPNCLAALACLADQPLKRVEIVRVPH